MLKKLLLLAAFLIGVFAVYIAVLPAGYTVARSTVIAAPPEAVFQHVDNFKKWDDWSPWAKRDPQSKAVFEGPENGKGAVFKWDGNVEVGKGRMTIEESIPPREIEIKLDFERPFEDTADVGFEFEPVENGTRVTWSLAGEQNYIERFFCTLMGLDMDRMIGTDYEQGLANLKRVIEKGA